LLGACPRPGRDQINQTNLVGLSLEMAQVMAVQ